jgi:RimJ/RimL family protein N-acetyltransferase
VRALNDEAAARFLFRVPYPYASKDFDAWLEMCANGWRKERAAHWNIAAATDDAYLGGVSLMLDEERAAAEIGYQVAPWARGRGVAARAARLVRAWSLDELGLERLEIHADADNIGSQRVALALGMRREGLCRGFLSARGVRRDHVLLAMTGSDPRSPVVPLPTPRLSDGFVVVRPLEPHDAPAVAAACQDPIIQERCYFVPSPYTLEDAQSFIAESRRSLVAGEEVHCAVVAAGGAAGGAPFAAGTPGAAPFAAGELLGAVDLVVFPEREAAETGYWVRREARGRGVATAALRLMIAFAFEQVGVERLELMTETPNVPSQRLAEKLGFRREGVTRAYLASRGERDRDLVDPAHGRIDQVLSALLRPEWEALAGRS